MKQNCRNHPVHAGAESLFAGPGEMRERCRALDWSATTLGPVATWDPALRAVVRLCLDCARPMCVFAGPELVAIYNDSYAASIGGVRHPQALARPARETWRDIWDSIRSEYEQVMAGGASVDHVTDSRYVVDRGRGLEETFWTWATSPIRGDDGRVIGCHTLISESTVRVQAERRAEGILERMQDAHCVLDREFTIVSVNASAERLLGRSRETLLGRSHWEAFPASFDAPVGRAFRRVVEEGVEQHLTHHYTGEGYDFHLEMDAYPTDDGGLAMFWRDVTERVRAEATLRESEERHTFLVRFSDAVRGLIDPSAVATTACRMLLEHLGVDRAHWGEVDWRTEEFVIKESVYSPGVPPLEGRFPLAAWEPYSVSHREGRAVAVNDTQTDPRADSAMRAATARLEIGADLAVPVLVGGRLASVLAVKQRQPRRWTPAEIALVEGVAGRCWAEVERARAEAALRESEARLARDLEATQVLQNIGNQLNSKPGANGHFNELCEAARALMQSECASIQVYDESGSRLKLVGHVGFHPDSAVLWDWVDAGVGSSCGWALATGDRVIVPDMDRFEAASSDVEAYRRSDIRSVQSTPLVARNGKVVGMMSTHWHAPSVPTEASYRFFDILARLAADFIVRIRAEDALRESEEKFRALFTEMDEAYAVVEVIADEAGRWTDFLFLDANPAFIRHTGMPYPVGRTATQLLGTPNPRWAELYGRVAESGQTLRVEEGELTLGRIFDLNIFRLGDTGSRRVAVLFTDITARKHAERALRASEERQAFLLQLSDALRPLDAAAEIQGVATRLLRDHFDAGWCYYVEWDETAARGVVLRDATRDGLPSLAGTHDVSDVPAFLDLLRKRNVLNVADYAKVEELSPALRARYTAVGFRSMLIAPLVKQGRLIASLLVGDTVVRDWSAEAEALLMEVAERTWAAVERARAEAGLRESEAKYRTLFESMDQGYCDAELVRDGDGRVVDVQYLTLNPAFERLFGIPVASAEGRRVREIVPGIEPWWFETYDRIARSQQSERFEHEVSPLGRWFDVHVYPRTDDRITVLYDDVTRRKHADQALRDSEERFRTMADLVPDLLWQSDPGGSTPWYNARWFEYTGQTPDQARGWGWTDTIHPDDRSRSAANYARAAERGEPLVQEHRIRRYDGEYRWFIIHAEPLRDDAGRVVRWIGAATDVHAQRMALEEAERLATERTTERDALRRQLAAAEEAERRRLARELHDQLGQQLTALALGLDDARRIVNDGAAGGDGEAPEPVRPLLDRLERLHALTRDMTMGARYLALELRPPELDDMGLENAIATYVREWRERFGIAADLIVARGVRTALPPDVASALYRITQEALTNVAKHARATSVSVIVEQVDGHVRLIVEDDGRGMELTAAADRARRERRLGLAGMQERAALLGGEVKIESSAGQGTAVFVRLPLGVTAARSRAAEPADTA